jgi:hypothetical protein
VSVVCLLLPPTAPAVRYSEVIQFDGLSPFRPYGRDLVEFCNSTGWAFPVKLTPNRPTSAWPVIS